MGLKTRIAKKILRKSAKIVVTEVGTEALNKGIPFALVAATGSPAAPAVYHAARRGLKLLRKHRRH